jgi:hypothetical protein
MGIVAKKRRKFMPRWLRGGALLKWGPFRAWIGSRLKPSGKCRITLRATWLVHHLARMSLGDLKLFLNLLHG